MTPRCGVIISTSGERFEAITEEQGLSAALKWRMSQFE